MRKFKLLCVLFACIFINSGCAANDLPIKRKTDSKDDVIKFYGFDWLTERSEVEKKFNEDFGSNYEYDEFIWEHINDKMDVVSVTYYGKNKTDLNWSIAGHKVIKLRVVYIKNKSGKYFLESAQWYFKNNSIDVKEDIAKKLDELYTRQETMETVISYSDKNINSASLSLTTKEGLELYYICHDISEQLIDIMNEYRNSQKESNNGL